MNHVIGELWKIKRLLDEAEGIDRLHQQILERGKPVGGMHTESYRIAIRKLEALIKSQTEPVKPPCEPAPAHDAIDAGALLIRLRKIATLLEIVANHPVVHRYAYGQVVEQVADLIAAAEKAKAVQDAAESGARRFEALFEGKPNWQGLAVAGEEPDVLD